MAGLLLAQKDLMYCNDSVGYVSIYGAVVHAASLYSSTARSAVQFPVGALIVRYVGNMYFVTNAG